MSRGGSPPAPGHTHMHIIIKNAQIQEISDTFICQGRLSIISLETFKYSKSFFILRQPLSSVSLPEVIHWPQSGTL